MSDGVPNTLYPCGVYAQEEAWGKEGEDIL